MFNNSDGIPLYSCITPVYVMGGLEENYVQLKVQFSKQIFLKKNINKNSATMVHQKKDLNLQCKTM